MDVLEAIRSSYLSSGLTDEQLRKLAGVAVSAVYQDGEEILTQDDISRDLYILAKGTAHIVGVTGEVIGVVRPGMPIGEVSFIDGRPRSVTVVSHQDSVAVILPYEPLWALLQEDRELALRALVNLSRVLCARLRATNKDLAALMAIEEAEPLRPRR